jgi:GTP-binding protein
VSARPLVALVGRPNVGKSTLFNRIAGGRRAIVQDLPGVTRDRNYADFAWAGRSLSVVDTGGFEPESRDRLVAQVRQQAQLAAEVAAAVVLVVDGREGLTSVDRAVAELLRRTRKPLFVAVNKVDTSKTEGEIPLADFYELGFGEVFAVSAEHGRGTGDLLDAVVAALALPPEPPPPEEQDEPEEVEEGDRPTGDIRLAIVGRPNVGKSTLVNALLGENRMIAFDAPGTTRDAIEVQFEYAGNPFTLIDTAGLRRRGKVFESVEKFSVVKTLQAIDQSNVTVLLLDAGAGIADQDAHIAGYIMERGRALVIAVNKWDGVEREDRERVRRDLERKLHFLRWAQVHYVSAQRPSGLPALMRSVVAAERAAFVKLPTPRLTRALRAAVERQEPARAGHSRPKLRYAHQGGSNPPVIVVHGNSLNHVQDNYRRYLEGWFRDHFDLQGTPLRIEFRTSVNPFVRPRAGKGRAFPVD